MIYLRFLIDCARARRMTLALPVDAPLTGERFDEILNKGPASLLDTSAFTVGLSNSKAECLGRASVLFDSSLVGKENIQVFSDCADIMVWLTGSMDRLVFGWCFDCICLAMRLLVS